MVLVARQGKLSSLNVSAFDAGELAVKMGK
jgi:hypothetical protein